MMKRFIAILFVTIVFASIIKAKAHEKNWCSKDDRSISIFLSIEENGLHIYSDKQWDNVGIQVVDPSGKTIYIDVIAITAEEELSIPLSFLLQGNYQVTLTKNNQPIIWYLTK